jgi:hypothetical protein
VRGSYALLLILSAYIFYIPAIYISSASPSSSAKDFSEFKGDGLSFEYPLGWSISASGKEYLGNLSINCPETERSEIQVSKTQGSKTAGRDDCIFLTWMRDPGIAPENILDQVESAYSSRDMKILSSQRGVASVRGGSVSTLDLGYDLRGSGTRKLFAVWNSSISDRLFFATYSTGDEGYSYAQNTSQNTSNFFQLLETFSDMPEAGATKLEPRSVKGDAWAVVLGDLLASYSYKDTKTLPARKIYLQTVHSLLPSNGIYLLSSKDRLNVDPPKTITDRAGAVQELLNHAGYETLLIQSKGDIWVAVQDASGRWQSVSLNPKEPGRMVGVLVGGLNEGIIYENISDLAMNNPIELGDENINSNIDDDIIDRIIRKDWEPSKYVELMRPSTENKTWIDDLQKVLDSHNYEKSYRENVFDCSNTSQICWSILQGNGYDARIMMSYKGHPLDPHMWVAVRYPYGAERWVAVETAITDMNERLVHLGRTTTKEDYYRGIMYNSSVQFSRLHPAEGMRLKY